MKKLICLFVFSFITSLVLAQNASQIYSLLLATKKLQGDAKAEALGKIFFFQFYASPQKAQQTAYQIWELAKVSENLHLKAHQSFATQATNERLELMKNQSISNKNIEVEINDLKDNQGNAKGTEIIILIPILI